MSHVHNYLLSHRKRLALSQDEVAFLLGTIDGTRVSRYERSTRIPELLTVLALEIILQKSARELFVSLHRKAQKNVKARAQALLDKMAKDPPTRQVLRKRHHLAAIISLEL